MTRTSCVIVCETRNKSKEKPQPVHLRPHLTKRSWVFSLQLGLFTLYRDRPICVGDSSYLPAIPPILLMPKHLTRKLVFRTSRLMVTQCSAFGSDEQFFVSVQGVNRKACEANE